MTSKKTTTQISPKSTKQEILDAYHEAMKTLKNEDIQAAVDTGKPEKIVTTGKKSSAASPRTLAYSVLELKNTIQTSLNELADELNSQSEVLEQVKKLVAQSQSELQESFQIKQTATTLKNILAISEQKKVELETDFAEFKKSTERLKLELEREEKERLEELKKQRTREVEEYNYTLTLSRQKEEDQYKRKQQQQEEILQKREKEIDLAEKEFKTLQKTVAEFEKTIEEKVNLAIAETKKNTIQELQTIVNLEKKDYEKNLELATLTIANLTSTVKNQESEIGNLKKQLANATTELKDIAVKVIESKQRDQAGKNE